LAKESYSAYWALFHALLGNLTGVIDITEIFLDEQYDKWFSVNLPDEYKEEFRGMRQGGIDAGYPELGRYAERGFTISSIATGDVAKDIEWLLINEENSTQQTDSPTLKYLSEHNMTIDDLTSILSQAFGRSNGQQCSMWGAWGSRTATNKLWTGRNLDWLAQSGIASYKLLTVFHPPNGHPHVTVGFAGLTGAITGMSAMGLTVHEAGDDNTMESGLGFGWGLRLRYVMENANDHASAKALWDATNTTMGLNHGIGSAKDNEFLVLEVKAGYTAYFHANDPREANYQVNGTYYGSPLPEALWRTNHGFDPEFLTTAMYTHPGTDTQTRYVLLHDSFISYQDTPIDELQAVNITALVGDKGGSTRDTFVTCDNAKNGINIISATYNPSTLIMYVAFENGMDDTHLPACCNYYVKFDMNKWFN
jgi:hypothetical protein